MCAVAVVNRTVYRRVGLEILHVATNLSVNETKQELYLRNSKLQFDTSNLAGSCSLLHPSPHTVQIGNTVEQDLHIC
jgi:hypothetical protein